MNPILVQRDDIVLRGAAKPVYIMCGLQPELFPRVDAAFMMGVVIGPFQE